MHVFFLFFQSFALSLCFDVPLLNLGFTININDKQLWIALLMFMFKKLKMHTHSHILQLGHGALLKSRVHIFVLNQHTKIKWRDYFFVSRASNLINNSNSADDEDTESETNTDEAKERERENQMFKNVYKED